MGKLTRREFSAFTLSTAIVGSLPSKGNPTSIESSSILVHTPYGEADCYLTHPTEGKHAGVLVWPDAMGLRPAFEQMAQRLAKEGYSVLVVNPYYRQEKAPILPAGASFRDPETRAKLFPLMRSLTPEVCVADATVLIDFLDSLDSVDTGRKIGTTGYCMGGSMTMRTAAALPERVGAGASFHGGRLVTDQEDSPHMLVPKMQANFLIAIAENDDANEPESKHELRKSFDAAGLQAEIEVYAGAQHGWCPPDSAVYHEEQAERAWSRMLALFEMNLG